MVTMAILDRKLVCDLRRMWAQVLAISLVMACGVATIVIAIGAYRSLYETRSMFYERYRFATVFAGAVRAPLQLRNRIAAIPDVAAFLVNMILSRLIALQRDQP